MTANTTEQERAEPIKMQSGDDLHLTMLMAPHGLNFVTGKDREQLLAWGRDVWQASRRAPVVQPDQIPPDAAKRTMEELQTEVESLRSALAECRDACPIPTPGASNEEAWMQSIGDPESVPAFVKSCLQAQVVPQELRGAAQDALDWLEDDHANLTHNIRERLRAALAAAPQPPDGLMSENRTSKPEAGCSVSNAETEAAPVQLPEAAGWVDDGGMLFWTEDTPPDGENIYTEQQVRQLLADQSAKENP